VLVRYNWPGNIRELENAIERAMVVGRSPAIQPDDLPFRLSEKNNGPHTGSLASIERAHIAEILDQNSWNISRSAEILEIDRVTLYNKISKYGLRKP
jgi:transcriptional regulator of acetoin/glycerol metabolism